MTITITAFERSPDGGKGPARDTRVRWALEGRSIANGLSMLRGLGDISIDRLFAQCLACF